MRWTDARRSALAVFRTTGQARYSNRTSAEHLQVYWQSADWLIEYGYVRPLDDLENVEITEKGLWALRGIVDL